MQSEIYLFFDRGNIHRRYKAESAFLSFKFVYKLNGKYSAGLSFYNRLVLPLCTQEICHLLCINAC